MPQVSEKNILLQAINRLEIKVAEAQLKNLQERDGKDLSDSGLDSLFGPEEYLIITPPSPITPFLNVESGGGSEVRVRS